jgi:hypothetical protein
MKRLLAMLTWKRVLIAAFLALEVSGVARANASASFVSATYTNVTAWLHAVPIELAITIALAIIAGGGAVFCVTAWLFFRELRSGWRWLLRWRKGQADSA